MENDPIQHIKDVTDLLIETAPEELLSHTVYIKHPDGVEEFMPKKEVGNIKEPSVEYINEKGENILETVDEGDGKFDILNVQPHIPGKKEHPHQHIKDQVEFNLE